jgi:GNAT superfamily N-acetyltransferase
MKLDFRFATSEDNNYFKNIILGEKQEIATQLGIIGFNPEEFNHNAYRVGFVVELGGERIAFSKVEGGGAEGFNYLSLFYVIPERRGKGIGTKFLKFVEDYCLNNWNANGIDAYTIANPRMDGFLKKNGFILSGTFKDRYIINGKSQSMTRLVKFYK